ncbi:MAG: InlB B-repeat-containing protein [Christensenellaceae bacterium]|nr:InlB B-repeat-containing protein [Christensenellaceae bacterium]
MGGNGTKNSSEIGGSAGLAGVGTYFGSGCVGGAGGKGIVGSAGGGGGGAASGVLLNGTGTFDLIIASGGGGGGGGFGNIGSGTGGRGGASDRPGLSGMNANSAGTNHSITQTQGYIGGFSRHDGEEGMMYGDIYIGYGGGGAGGGGGGWDGAAGGGGQSGCGGEHSLGGTHWGGGGGLVAITLLSDVYSISYDLNDAGFTSAQWPGGAAHPATYIGPGSTAISITNPTRRGYTFEGWTVDYDQGLTALPDVGSLSASYSVPAEAKGDIALMAHWVPVQYTISYDFNDGSLSSSAAWDGATHPSGYNITNTAIANISDLECDGYTFRGWTIDYDDNTVSGDVTSPVTSPTIPASTTGDIAFTAQWEIIEYTIVYDLQGGQHPSPGDYPDPHTYNVEGSFPIAIPDPERAGFSFGGWDVFYGGNMGTADLEDQTGYSVLKTTLANIRLVAKWIPIDYSITYDLQGGAHAGTPNQYTVPGLPLTLVKPTRLGYNFLGWSVTSDDAGIDDFDLGPNEALPLGKLGSLMLTAKWQKRNVLPGGGGESSGTAVIPQPSPVSWWPWAKTKPSSSVPQTGDDANLPAWALALLVAVLGAGALGWRGYSLLRAKR